MVFPWPGYTMKIAITVDIEKDIGFMDTCYGIDEALPLLLDIFEKNNIRATFFISGQAAEYLNKRGFLKRLADDSHEIASHGYAHSDYRGWDYRSILHEVSRSKQVLEDFSGRSVRGYRSPQFLINENIIRAVQESGFAYDSSLPDSSGISAAKTLRHVRTDSKLAETIRESGIKEFPIDSIPVVKIPHGILWINLITLDVYKFLFNSLKKDFMIFFLHPFDLVKRKNRVHLDLKRKLFYLKNQNKVDRLLINLIQFWLSKDVNFVKLEDEL